jgi:membrane associated rhomboid family serine protease
MPERLAVYLNLNRHTRFLAVRIGVIYIVSGVGGSVLSSLFIRNNISVGASGALFGLLGAMLSELFTNWTIYSNKVHFISSLLAANLVPILQEDQCTECRFKTECNLQAAALATLLVVIAINLAIGILPHVDNFAHIGGFLTGFLLGFIFLMRPHYGWMQRYVRPSDIKYTTKKYLPYQWVLLAVASVLAVLG